MIVLSVQWHVFVWSAFYFKRCPIFFLQSYKSVIWEHLEHLDTCVLRQTNKSKTCSICCSLLLKNKLWKLSISFNQTLCHIKVRVVDIILITMINANIMDESKRNKGRISFIMIFLHQVLRVLIRKLKNSVTNMHTYINITCNYIGN